MHFSTESTDISICQQNIWCGYSLEAPRLADALLMSIITKTYLYNFDPIKLHFYIVKLRYTGVYLIFLTSAHRLWVLVRTASVLTSTNNLCFEQKYENISEFLSEKFQFLVLKLSIYLNRRVLVMPQT